MSDIDPAVVMAAHLPVPVHEFPNVGCIPAVICRECDVEWPCEPYRLAEALVAAQEDVARLSAYSAAAFDQRDAAQDALAASEAKVAQASVAESTYEGFTGCTDSNPDVCACSTHEDPECEVCGGTVEAGDPLVELTRMTYPLMSEDHPEQEWEYHSAHARCFRSTLADRPEQAS